MAYRVAFYTHREPLGPRRYLVTQTEIPEVGGVAPPTFNPTGIPSEQAFGTPTFTMGASPSGIASQEAFGTPTFVGPGGAPVFLPEGIATGEAFGTPQLNLSFMPEGIESGEAFSQIAVKTEPHPDETVVFLRGGPFDGEARIVGEPWPRDEVIVEDPVTGRFYSYFVDVLDTEPYEGIFSDPSPTVTEETGSGDFVLIGEKGDRGIQGEIGPQGEPGTDGTDFFVGLPAINPAMEAAGGFVVSDDGAWVEMTDGIVEGYEPFGYRYEGNYLVCKGVIDKALLNTIGGQIPLPPPSHPVASTVVGPVFGIQFADPAFLEVAYVSTGGFNFGIPNLSGMEADAIVGWDGIRVAYQHPWPPDPTP